MELKELTPFRRWRRGGEQGGRDAALGPFERMHEEMDRLFEDFLPQFSDRRELESRMKGLAQIDLSETDDALEIDVDLPGVKEGDIDVTFRDGALFITGERKHESEEKKKNYYRSERSYGSFSRSITLPCDVEADQIDARFKKGVLKIMLPKSPAAKESQRKIEIRAA